MNFLYLNYLPVLILGLMAFIALVIYLERRFFKVVQRYWFYERSIFSYLATILFLTGISMLALSLLDARGPEVKIKTPVPKERTIILIDTSASMLAEDVKPSRLQKAALIAKHFARKATGHQLSIVAFAEIQKKIVPFTNDLDLIDARLDSLKTLRNQYGSSALTLAIQESIQYFRETGGDAGGNILVLTDGEETAGGIKLKVPKDVRVALIGIGTAHGGRIPMDDGRGFRFGYKKNNGIDVVTKLNENFFKSVVDDLPSGKYWLANTYSLPSEDVVEFFKSEFTKGMDEQDMVIRPVMMEWLVIPALLALILSYLFKAIRIFTLSIFLICLALPVQAQDQTKEVELSPEIQGKMQDLSRGALNKLEKIKLADELYQAGAKPEALALYEENLTLPRIDGDVPAEAYLNYGTALLENKEELKGLGVYQSLKDGLTTNPHKAREIDEIMNKNVVTHFKIQEQKKKEQQKKEKEKKENKEKNDQDSKSGKDQDQKQGKGQQDPNAGKSDQSPPDKNEPGEDKKDKDKEKGEEPKQDQDQDKKDGEEPKPDEADKGEIKKARKKVDPKLRQLMDDDRQLQIKMIENGTRELNKRKDRKSKDW